MEQGILFGFDMGTLYTMIAGLLNILVVFDAYGGPLPPPAKPQRGQKKDAAESPPDPTSEPASSSA